MKIAVGSLFLLLVSGAVSVEWKHSAVLDNNFLVLWTPGERDVTFEIQVKTLGYVGLGFTKDDGRAGADMVIGWVDNNGQVHLQLFLHFPISLPPRKLDTWNSDRGKASNMAIQRQSTSFLCNGRNILNTNGRKSMNLEHVHVSRRTISEKRELFEYLGSMTTKSPHDV
ncbi:MOXD1-like protein [Ooceraea biroi]|uniref:MOXD1-like protein n=1 Tax=Ooceraea biroi TaxID=2015173 RepID=A0A026X1W7_OOCBI|nr:MOXD1-like protein [Ooceraea biroi]